MEISKYLQDQQLRTHDSAKSVLFTDACIGVRESLAQYKSAVISENIARIEKYIWKRFKQLLRKKKMGKGISIDSSTYTLSVLDANGSVIPSERLSMGERQLLATAMLWGLTDASSKLPVVIDTPLGRLDREHRSNLVSEYFPKASSQVVLLSTDEEINERWLPGLEESISRTYTIEFNDEDQCSSVIEGYFEMEPAHAS